MFATVMPYSIRAQLAPRIFTSTTPDSTTFTATTYGDNYAVTLMCKSGTLCFSAVGVAASSTVGNQIVAGSDATLFMKKTATNPTAMLSLFCLSTADVWQAVVYA